MDDDQATGELPAPDAHVAPVADEPDPAFDEIEDDDIETPDDNEPDPDDDALEA